MAEPATLPSLEPGKGPSVGAGPSAVDKLRQKSVELRGPRGAYRCRKCKQLPCVCPDPKPARAGATTPAKPGALAPHPELFTEANSKRLLESAFGIPVVLTRCRVWELTEAEALELAKPTSLVLNEFVTVDPKWVALSLLLVSLGSIVSRKAVMYAAWKQSMEIERRARAVKAGPVEPKPKEPAPSSETPTEGPGPSASLDALYGKA